MVSVVIPFLNSAKYIRESIESVLKQDFVSEILLIDDGSTDDSRSIVLELAKRDKRIKLLQCEQSGIANALNYGVNHAKTNLIARLDSDDVMSDDRIKNQLMLWVQLRNIVLLASQVNYISSKGVRLGISKYPIGKIGLLKHLAFRNPIAHPSVIFRRDSVLMAGAYRAELAGAEDLDLWIRLIEFGEIYVSPNALTSYRQHSEQVTYSGKAFQSELELRKKYLLEPDFSSIKKSLFSILQLVRLTDLYLLRCKVIYNIRNYLKLFRLR